MIKKLLTGIFLTLFSTSIFSQADQLFATDVIVLGSMQIGVNATNDYNFGADTFVMTENNLRMLFDDTSTSASFPNNDWRFTFNDQSNGGGNYFSIDDVTGGAVPFRVDAGAPNNSFRIADNGNIGIGTDKPGSIELHVVDENTPTLRLNQDNSVGLGDQSWDIAGNESNFFIRDVTNGNKLPFKIQPKSPTNTLVIGKNGNIGVGFDENLFPNINTNASIHMASTTKGLLINRMTTDQRTTFGGNLNSRLNGMMVYDTEENKLYLWNGTEWVTGTDAQDLDISGNTLSLTNDGTSVDLSGYLDNTDQQTLILSNSSLTITGGNTIDLSVVQDGTGTDNQTLDLSSNILSIANGNTVDLSSYVNTDSQDLTSASLYGTNLTIEIENGTSVTVDLASVFSSLETDLVTAQGEISTLQTQMAEILSRLDGLEQSAIGKDNPIKKGNMPILYQNIPNPLTDTSMIKYYLPSDEINNASIIFSNSIGQVVSIVSLDKSDNGVLNINSDGLAKGTYFYSLYIGNRKMDTKKMVVK